MKTVASSRAKRTPSKNVPPPPTSTVATKRPKLSLVPPETRTTTTLETIAATGTTLDAMRVAIDVLETYPWPAAATTAIVAAVSDVIVPEILTSPRAAYYPAEHWHKRISDELAARGVPSAPPAVEAMSDAINTLAKVADILSRQRIASKATKHPHGDERERAIMGELRVAADHLERLSSRLRASRRGAA